MTKFPSIKKECKILILCEGEEDYDYISKLKECKVWSSAYSVKLKNAKSIDNLIAIYQNMYHNANYDLILTFCDTEMTPYEQFSRLWNGLNEFHGENIAENIMIFANPCTMQIILSHFAKVKLKSNNKTKNSPLIEKYTGVKNYEANQNQRTAIMKHISKENYFDMKNNLKGVSNSYDIVPSTNAVSWFELFENENTEWVMDLKKKIE